MRFEDHKNLLFDEEKFAKCKRQIQIRSQVTEEAIEQLEQNQITWLAIPLPWRIRVKLRLQRQFRKLIQAIAEWQQWNDRSR